MEEQGLTVRDVAAYTGFPEMLDGRVKTLHPKIHGGILARHDRPDDLAALAAHGIASFELVVVNLYPFEATVARAGVTFDEAVEQIDIGGPSLIRAAAKNHAFVTVATDPAQYSRNPRPGHGHGIDDCGAAAALADAAFARTARYDASIAQYLAGASEPRRFPRSWHVELRRKEVLRYGENPHQQAALYAERDAAQTANLVSGPATGRQGAVVQQPARSRQRPGHRPLARRAQRGGDQAQQSLRRGFERRRWPSAARAALDGDPQSAFGSVLGFNRPFDAATADVLAEPERFVEAIVAPDFDAEALEILTTRPKWKANVRLMKVGSLDAPPAGWQLRQIEGGMLVQEADTQADPQSEWRVVTAREPTREQWDDLRFAWAIVRHVKSNAIVLAADRTLVGTGAGQMSRVDSVEIAIKKAGARARGSVLASDAFFPFADSIQQAAAAGVAAIIQPGGSRRDDEVIAACNEHQLPMVFTGRRHFKH